MKHVWRKDEKNIYQPKTTPEYINIPEMNYLSLSGTGDPNNNPIYQRQIEILYTISYTIRMMPKNGLTPEGYFEYTVYPLEGVWSSKSDYSKTNNKADFIYDIMIRQPIFVTKDLVNTAIETAISKKKLTKEEAEFINFITIPKGEFVQIMHIGPFSTEKASFDIMEEFIKSNDMERPLHSHREIYLSDFRKTEPEKLKTVLRVGIKKLDSK